ncbi:MAG: urease accessory protein UreD [Clostridiales Family XIII bacterium]|jgi:urease accessory protein|nr:urease accessory protein UreD [Clostridiales Family XIII bacterium]
MAAETTGIIRLDFKNDGGQTYLASQYYKLPLQILPPHCQDDDGTAFIYLLNPSGGIMQGDRLSTEIHLRKQARVLATSPSCAKFYRMEDGFAYVKTLCTIGEEAVLEYLPEHNVPFSGSKTRLENLFYLKKSSTLLALEMLTAGRKTRGESFQYGYFISRTKIYVEGELTVFDSMNLNPENEDLRGVGLFEGHEAAASLYIYRAELPENATAAANEAMQGQQSRGGVSQIGNIAIVRILADDVRRLRETMSAVWKAVRPILLGKEAVTLRKY